MKKQILVGLCAAAMTAVLSISALAATTTAMTQSEAEALAGKYIPSGSTKLRTEYDDGRYEISYYNEGNQEKYEVKVSPFSKKITEFDSERFQNFGSLKATLSEEEAKKVVTDELTDAEILSSYLKYDDGLREYEVYFKTDSYYGEYTIHPETGVILERDIKVGSLTTGTASGTTQSSGSSITAEQAKQIAMAQAPGASVTKCKLDRDDGRTIYEVELRNGMWEYEFEIDAAGGQILKFEKDYDD